MPDLSRRQPIVRFANWANYIDVGPGGSHPTLSAFTRRTGISVRYAEVISGNAQFVGMIGPQLVLGEEPGWDVAVLTDWMTHDLFASGWIQPLDASKIPNARNLVASLRDRPIPGVARYALPWQGGFTGIAWNARVVGSVASMEELLVSQQLHGRVGLVSDMRDVMGLMLLDMGIDPASFVDADFNAALRRLAQAANAGQIQTVTNDYLPGLRSGRLAACVAWAGDILAAQRTDPHLRFMLPTAGGMLWTDNMVIPAYAPTRTTPSCS